MANLFAYPYTLAAPGNSVPYKVSKKMHISRGDWLGNPANIKVENNGAVGYVGSSLPVHNPPGGGGSLGISGWGCAAGTLEPLTYTRASSAEFCHPILELTPQLPPPPPHPRVAVFQKLLRSLAQ